MAPPVRHPSRRTPPLRSPSNSPSPDPELMRYLSEQKRPQSPDSEAFRRQRIAAGGVLNVKSKYQRDKEEAERKKIDEEEKAEKAYREFVKDMQGGEGEGGEERDRGRGFVSAGGSSSYTPSSRQNGPMSASASTPLAPRAMRGEAPTNAASVLGGEGDHDEEMQQSSRLRDPPGKRKRAMDDFLGELQRDQAQREERLRGRVADGESISTLLAQEAEPSRPWDSHHPASSNVCVLNLPSNVSEMSFGEYFSQYGDIASVKIMWPRLEESLPPALRSTKSAGATGFVNFMTRGDAERAYREIEGSTWMGSLLRTGWGKPLRRPMQPLFVQSHGARHDVESRTGVEERPTRSSRSPRSRNHRRGQREDNTSSTRLLQAAVERQSGGEAERRIAAVAGRVREYGRSFEDMVQKRESGNADYEFLRRKDSVQHQYFRLLIDDSYEVTLPLRPFQDDGSDSLYSSDSEEDSERERLRLQHKGKELGKAARRRLEAMLRGITLRRERVARVMAFAIEHAAAAESVSEVIVQSLLQPATPLSRKLARLYVVSDILHNSSVSASNAWRYRSLFEAMLDNVFLHWGDVSNAFVGRIKRESCKEMVRIIFNVWEDWLVFENAKLTTWRGFVDKGSAAGGESNGREAVALATAEELDGEEM